MSGCGDARVAWPLPHHRVRGEVYLPFPSLRATRERFLAIPNNSNTHLLLPAARPIIFGVSYDRQGRARATWVADEDRSYVRLPLRDERVASAHWRRWREADGDSSDEGWDIGLDDDEYY